MTRYRPWDIAIVGMACRFPGAAHPRAFWDNLVGGVESITFFSDAELLAAGEDRRSRAPPLTTSRPPRSSKATTSSTRRFFGYSPREARLMDPQHRLFLEVAWEAFEDAGYDPLGGKGHVGVYAGAGGLVSSYMVRLCHPDLRGQTGDLGHIGNDRDFLCSRVSFKLNLTGPSVNVQSACSTSLLAVHLACRGLLDGEADMALAGASVVRVPHVRGYLAEPGNIYSIDGHCRAFDAKASGTLFGSGVAALLLKPLASRPCRWRPRLRGHQGRRHQQRRRPQAELHGVHRDRPDPGRHRGAGDGERRCRQPPLRGVSRHRHRPR